MAVAKRIQRWLWRQHGQMVMTVAMAAQTTILKTAAAVLTAVAVTTAAAVAAMVVAAAGSAMLAGSPMSSMDPDCVKTPSVI